MNYEIGSATAFSKKGQRRPSSSFTLHRSRFIIRFYRLTLALPPQMLQS